MSQLRIFSTKTDPYLPKFKQRAKELGLKVMIYHYELFSFKGDSLTYRGSKPFPQFSEKDTVFFRRTLYSKRRQHFWVRLLAILAENAGAKVVNAHAMVSFPMHSGKLFQAALFSAKEIPHIPTYRLNSKNVKKFLPGPWLIKKRYGAFGEDSRLVMTEKELDQARKELQTGKSVLDDYIVQHFFELKRDLRVMVVDGKILGAVERQVKIHDDKKVGVKVAQIAKLSTADKKMVEQTIESLDLEIAGVDLFTDLAGRTWVGEINYFPNFESFMRIAGEDVFEQILRAYA